MIAFRFTGTYFCEGNCVLIGRAADPARCPWKLVWSVAEVIGLTVWVDLLNLNAGDLSSFEIRDPAGEVVLSGRLCEPAEQSLAQSFWRFGWTGNGVTSQAGDWRAVYLRNGVEEASTDFSLAP